MGMVKIADIAVGMVLAEPLTDMAGRTLLRDGTMLTALHIDRLKEWGVHEVAIANSGGEEEVLPVFGWPIHAREWPATQSAIDHMFEKAQADKMMLALKRAILVHVSKLKELYG